MPALLLWTWIIMIIVQKIVKIDEKQEKEFANLLKKDAPVRSGFSNKADTVPVMLTENNNPFRKRFIYQVGGTLCMRGYGDADEYSCLIRLLSQLLQGRECNIFFSHNGNLISFYTDGYRRYGVEVKREGSSYMVMELCRYIAHNKREEEDKVKAVISAVALWGDRGLGISDRENRQKIQQLIREGRKEEAQVMLMDEFGESLLSIDKEDSNKISLLESEGIRYIKFDGENIDYDGMDNSMSEHTDTAYDVAYRYCEKLRRADDIEWADDVQNKWQIEMVHTKEYNSFVSRLPLVRYYSRCAVNNMDIFTYANRKCGIDGLIAAAYLFSPDIIQIEDYIFLKDFWGSDKKYAESLSVLKEQYNDSKKMMEMHVNTCSLGDFFFYSDDPIMDDYNVLNQFGEALVYYWGKRAKELFPDRNIVVALGEDLMDEIGPSITMFEDTETDLSKPLFY